MQWMEVKKGSAKAVRSFKRPITKRRILPLAAVTDQG